MPSTVPSLLPAVSLLRERQGVGAGQGWLTKWDEGPQGLAPLPLPPHGGHHVSPLCSGQATVRSLLQEVPPPNTHHLDPSTSPFSASLFPENKKASEGGSHPHPAKSTLPPYSHEGTPVTSAGHTPASFIASPAAAQAPRCEYKQKETLPHHLHNAHLHPDRSLPEPSMLTKLIVFLTN